MRRINHKQRLEDMRATGNSTLLKVVDCLLKAEANDFSPEDQAAFDRVESYRNQLLGSTEIVDFKVFGSDDTETISNVCKAATSPKIWARLIYALASEFEAKKVLEIGTNLGVSGSYLLEALRHNSDSQLVTMEGMPRYVEISRNQFKAITNEDRFEVIEGKYEDTFDDMIDRHQDFDLLFIDGNHQKGPTLEYYEKLLKVSTRPSVWIFDDIYWTNGMKEAWDIIRQNPETSYSIDLYKTGLVVVDPSVSVPKHFALHLAY
ncbi:O-methyltransferase [Lewinella sp. 4G2]|uniref:O-methyltransferase n=1 Tax=Lewinella sp. 4G2 TaxID=1803372 RepID=UPI0018D2BA70|nr:class I SAM-dependent methyltransferase [Lewinella sp. 4G2]